MSVKTQFQSLCTCLDGNCFICVHSNTFKQLEPFQNHQLGFVVKPFTNLCGSTSWEEIDSSLFEIEDTEQFHVTDVYGFGEYSEIIIAVTDKGALFYACNPNQ